MRYPGLFNKAPSAKVMTKPFFFSFHYFKKASLWFYRKRRSHSRASQEAFIDLGSGDDTDSTVMEEGKTPRAPSVSAAVTAAESILCPTGAVAPVLTQVTTPAQTPVLSGKNSALVSGKST